jgi:NADH-quinone oxidoreductase subunit K
VVAFFVMALAAAEVAVGLAIVVSVYRSRRKIDLDAINELRN